MVISMTAKSQRPEVMVRCVVSAVVKTMPPHQLERYPSPMAVFCSYSLTEARVAWLAPEHPDRVLSPWL